MGQLGRCVGNRVTGSGDGKGKAWSWDPPGVRNRKEGSGVLEAERGGMRSERKQGRMGTRPLKALWAIVRTSIFTPSEI